MKRISIVLEETPDESFRIFVEGDVERIGNIPENELTDAEYWAAILYENCIEHLKYAGLELDHFKPEEKH